MNKRKLNVASLMINLTVLILTAYSVAHNFRTDVIREIEWFDFSGFLCLRYFTNLSNIFSAGAAAIILVFNVKNVINDEYVFPKWAITVKYVSACAVAVTFVTVTVFLTPMVALNGKSFFLLFKGNSFFVHFLNPLLAIINIILFERTPALSFKNAAIGVIPTLIYSVVYVVLVVGFKIWPDFYNFTFNGTYWALPIVIACMYGMAFGLAAAIYALRKKATAKLYEKSAVSDENTEKTNG